MSEQNTETKEIHKAAIIAPPKSIFRDYFESFVTTLVMALFGMTFILQAVTVPTGSMQNTILVGDYLLVNKFIFSGGENPLPFLPQRKIQRGDIVVFKYPGFRDGRSERVPPYFTTYVKRVIGMPGDKVEFRNNQVFINDQLLPEHRVLGDPPINGNARDGEAALETSEFEPKQDDQKYSVYYSKRTMTRVQEGKSVMDDRGFNWGVEGKPMKVPDDSYFVMGDSRDNSEDGRFWGFVNRDLIIGKPMFVYWSCDRSGDTMASCITNPRFDRIGKIIR